MYRIKVNNRGKYNNVVPGIRYCLTKRSIKDMIEDFADVECDFIVEKLTYLHSDIFMWTKYYYN